MLCYMISSSSCSKPRGGGWASGRDGMRRGSRSRDGWRFRGWAGRSRCCTSHIAVDQCTAIARTDGDGLAHIVAQRLEDVLAEVAQILDYWLWCVVVDLATACCLTTCELRQLEVFCKLNIVHDVLIFWGVKENKEDKWDKDNIGIVGFLNFFIFQLIISLTLWHFDTHDTHDLK